MSETVIKVENLGKKYIIGHQPRERYLTFRDAITSKTKALFNPLGKKKPEPDQEEFWALKDISFEVKQGDRVGVIGRNGAGKSTLLKVLSKITEPTTGQIRIKGRVASLLEVGTGFHPELTGRENIYLNGAILGMSRAEIGRKFDEIVDFAEVEKFLDTPVKRYSSGMYVRLAFAVAAHLEPEILVVDEVLAVGDAQFQKKCLGKMEDVSKEGRTIIFVSHNLSIIQSLCQRCVVLNQGKLIVDELTIDAIQAYLEDGSVSNSFVRHPSDSKNPYIASTSLNQTSNEYVEIVVELFSENIRTVSIDMRLSDAMGVAVGFGSLGSLNPMQLLELKSGVNHIAFSTSTSDLATGTYYVSLDITLPDVEIYDRVDKCLSFDVNRPPKGTARRVLAQSWGYGSIELPLELVKFNLGKNTI
jgi:lipopolysaccharide transport system ATP-binding protein